MMKRGASWFWVFGDTLELVRDAERLQRRLFTADSLQSRVPCWEPPVDLYEHGSELTLHVALPGVASSQIEVALESGAVVVRGKRPMPPALLRGAIHHLEIPYGRFERRIKLPPGSFSLHEQFLEGGCLVVVLRHF